MTHDTSGVRRRAPRLPILIEGSLRGRTERAVSVVDLSLTGCLVRCGSALDHGAILDLHFELEEDHFGAKVQVTESSLDGATGTEEPARYLAGLAFLGLPAREEARLRRFLEDERRRRSADAPPQ
jgi:c-di-GMP-binding flagellar brake protein YcgR